MAVHQRHILTRALLVTLTGFFLGGAALSPALGTEAGRVRLQLKWFHQFQFAGYYAAKEMGYYAREGLDVHILEGGPGKKVQDIVTRGGAEFGVLGSELVLHRARGMDVVVVAPIIQHSIRTLIARKDRGIATPHDLMGKNVMLNKNELAEFTAMFFKEGIDPRTIYIHAKDTAAISRFIRGEIDAINGSIANQPFLLRENQVPFTLIRPVHYGIDFYGDTLFTTAAFLKKNKRRVAAFLRATTKGWQFAFDHPEAAADIILDHYVTKKSKPHLMFEQARLREIIHPNLVQIGHNNPKRWDHIVMTYKQLGLLPDAFTTEGLFYRDYIGTEAVWVKRMLWAAGMAVALFSLVFLWNFRLKRVVRKATAEIIESRENLKTTLDSIGDAVIATDRSGRVTRMNPVAEALTGWTFSRARGRDIAEVFRIIHSQTRKPALNPVSRVLKEGETVGPANHTALISRDGTEYQISDSGAPIRDHQGRITGVVMVFRDMTEEYSVQERIRRNEKRLRSYLESAPYGIFITDGRGRIREINTALGRTARIKPGEFTGKPLSSLLEGGLEPEAVLSRALSEGTFHGESVVLTPSGPGPVCEIDLVKLDNDRLLGFVNDISRRKTAEAQADNLAKFPEENPHPVLRVDPEGRIVYANPGSRDLLEFWEADVGSRVPGTWKRRIAEAFRYNTKILVEEIYGDICMSLVITPFSDLSHVNIYGMDVTEQHRTRQLLKKSEEKYRELVEGTNDLITIVSHRWEFIFVNKVAAGILGIPPEEAIGRSALDFVHPDDRVPARAWFNRSLDQKAPSGTIENRQVNSRTGEVFHMLWTCNFHYGADGALKTVNSVARDITDRKRLEAEREIAEANLRQASKMEAVGNIAGGIAHDFNNVLGIIVGNTELALEDIPEWMVSRKYLKEIKTASLRATEVVRQLLSFSRKSEQVKKVIRLQPVIRESIALLRSSIPASVEFKVKIDPDTGPVRADATQIHQILINLCTNASHAMDEESGMLTIRLARVELDSDRAKHLDDIVPGSFARLTITDTGHGIDPATLTKIFDPYFTTKEVGKGTGMGLAVVLGIVKSHNGAITVDSQLDRGTAFNIFLPLADGAAATEDDPDQSVPTGSGRILLVDDEPALLILGRNQLESVGYQVETREDPLDALAAVRSAPDRFDLLITDMTMPHLNGNQLIEKVRAVAPGLPVLLCSGFSDRIDHSRSREVGIDGYIEKPFRKNRLARAVSHILGTNPKT